MVMMLLPWSLGLKRGGFSLKPSGQTNIAKEKPKKVMVNTIKIVDVHGFCLAVIADVGLKEDNVDFFPLLLVWEEEMSRINVFP